MRWMFYDGSYLHFKLIFLQITGGTLNQVLLASLEKSLVSSTSVEKCSSNVPLVNVLNTFKRYNSVRKGSKGYYWYTTSDKSMQYANAVMCHLSPHSFFPSLFIYLSIYLFQVTDTVSLMKIVFSAFSKKVVSSISWWN